MMGRRARRRQKREYQQQLQAIEQRERETRIVPTRHTRFYLDKQRAKWSGVCAGISDYTGINVGWIRLGAIVATVTFAFPWTLIAYWIAAKTFEAKPIELYGDYEDRKFWQGVRQSPRRTARDVKGKFRELDRRLAEMELYYTSNNRALSNEIESLR